MAMDDAGTDDPRLSLRLADLENADAVGCCQQPDWPCFAGNWWCTAGLDSEVTPPATVGG